MALNVKFTINESVNGKYLTFTDITGDYNVTTNQGGWGAPNTTRLAVTQFKIQLTRNSVITTYILPSVTEPKITDLQSGIQITPADLGLDGDVFEDGIYSFVVVVNTTFTSTPSVIEGFAATITSLVMKDSLNYRTYIDTKIKGRILEQNRLLDNLSYSAQIGAQAYFNENLLMLQKIIS